MKAKKFKFIQLSEGFAPFGAMPLFLVADGTGTPFLTGQVVTLGHLVMQGCDIDRDELNAVSRARVDQHESTCAQ